MKELAQSGINKACVDCGDLPFAGGMRCLPCFQKRVDNRAKENHCCSIHDPSLFCYTKCRCRCEACRKESARDRREREKLQRRRASKDAA